MNYSIIIPVYNSEKTLNRCVDSLLDQNYPDAEIILINDGSRDGSEAICREYERRYESIRLISQENAGVSVARNAGLDAAQGRYILFVDSDDYVMPDFFVNIDRMIVDNDADLIQFSGCVDNGTEKHESVMKPIRAGSREELTLHIIDAICRKELNGPWAKLYRRDLIESHHIRFPVGASVAEDRAFNMVYSFYIHSFIRSEYVGYVLNTENGNSLSRKRHYDLQKQFNIVNEYIDSQLAAAPIADTEKEGYRQAINFSKCRSIYHDAKLMIQDHDGWLKRQKQLMRICRIINKKHMKYPKTRYCRLITIPVRLYMTLVIDAVAKRSLKSV